MYVRFHLDSFIKETTIKLKGPCDNVVASLNFDKHGLGHLYIRFAIAFIGFPLT